MVGSFDNETTHQERKNRMTRFQKEIRKRGIKTEKDYPYLPYDINGGTIEGIVVNSEKCRVKIYYNVGTMITTFSRSMKERNYFI